MPQNEFEQHTKHAQPLIEQLERHLAALRAHPTMQTLHAWHPYSRDLHDRITEMAAYAQAFREDLPHYRQLDHDALDHATAEQYASWLDDAFHTTREAIRQATALLDILNREDPPAEQPPLTCVLN